MVLRIGYAVGINFKCRVCIGAQYRAKTGSVIVNRSILVRLIYQYYCAECREPVLSGSLDVF